MNLHFSLIQLLKRIELKEIRILKFQLTILIKTIHYY